MKKYFLSLVLAVFMLPLTAGAATVSITNNSFSGGGSIANASNVTAATATHTGITGAFDDTWTVNLNPSSATFNIATSIPDFTSFNAEYNTGSGWVTFNPAALVPGILQSLSTGISNVASFQVHVFGTPLSASSSYQLHVSAVPIPAAVWLFGSALVGLFGASRRKSTGVAA